MRTLLDQFDDKGTKMILRLPAWVRPFMRFATFIGEPVFTVGTGLLVIGAGLARPDEPLLQAGIIVVLTVCIGAVLKLILRRRRPLTYVVKWWFATFSFPSGHTVGAVISYGTLAYLSWHLPGPWGQMAATLLCVLIVAVGVSRVYLGAHYPSDVAAGLLLGGAGLAVIMFMIQPAV